MPKSLPLKLNNSNFEKLRNKIVIRNLSSNIADIKEILEYIDKLKDGKDNLIHLLLDEALHIKKIDHEVIPHLVKTFHDMTSEYLTDDTQKCLCENALEEQNITIAKLFDQLKNFGYIDQASGRKGGINAIKFINDNYKKSISINTFLFFTSDLITLINNKTKDGEFQEDVENEFKVAIKETIFFLAINLNVPTFQSALEIMIHVFYWHNPIEQKLFKILIEILLSLSKTNNQLRKNILNLVGNIYRKLELGDKAVKFHTMLLQDCKFMTKSSMTDLVIYINAKASICKYYLMSERNLEMLINTLNDIKTHILNDYSKSNAVHEIDLNYLLSAILQLSQMVVEVENIIHESSVDPFNALDTYKSLEQTFSELSSLLNYCHTSAFINNDRKNDFISIFINNFDDPSNNKHFIEFFKTYFTKLKESVINSKSENDNNSTKIGETNITDIVSFYKNNLGIAKKTQQETKNKITLSNEIVHQNIAIIKNKISDQKGICYQRTAALINELLTNSEASTLFHFYDDEQTIEMMSSAKTIAHTFNGLKNFELITKSSTDNHFFFNYGHENLSIYKLEALFRHISDRVRQLKIKEDAKKAFKETLSNEIEVNLLPVIKSMDSLSVVDDVSIIPHQTHSTSTSSTKKVKVKTRGKANKKKQNVRRPSKKNTLPTETETQIKAFSRAGRIKEAIEEAKKYINHALGNENQFIINAVENYPGTNHPFLIAVSRNITEGANNRSIPEEVQQACNKQGYHPIFCSARGKSGFKDMSGKKHLKLLGEGYRVPPDKELSTTLHSGARLLVYRNGAYKKG